MFRADDNEIVGDISGDRADKTIKSLSKSKNLNNNKFENWTYILIIEVTEKSIFSIPSAKNKAFNRLRQAFIETPIFRYFDPECHIPIKTNALDYTISRILSLLSSDWEALDGLNLIKSVFSQWYLIAYFSRKMIPAETWYKTYNAKLLPIVEVLKTLWHYLVGYNIKFLYLPTIAISVDLWILRIWAPLRFSEPKAIQVLFSNRLLVGHLLALQ